MQNAFKSTEWKLTWLHQTFKIEIQKGGPNNSDFLQHWFAQKLDPHSLTWRNYRTLRKALSKNAECIII